MLGVPNPKRPPKNICSLSPRAGWRWAVLGRVCTGSCGTAVQCAPKSTETWEKSPLGVQRLADNKKRKFELTSQRTLGLSLLCLCSGQKIHYTPRAQHCSQENALPKELHGLILPCPWREHQGSLGRGQCHGRALITPKNHLWTQRPQKHLFFETKPIK